MGSVAVVVLQEGIEIRLQLLERAIQLLPKRDAIKLVEQGFVKPLADPVRLGTLRLRSGVLDVLNGEVQLIGMTIRRAAILRATIREDPTYRDLMLGKKRQHAIVEQVRRGDRRLLRIQLGERDLAVRVDEGLLIDATDAFQRPHIKRVLRAAVPRAFTFEFAARFLLPLHALERLYLRLGQHTTLARRERFQRG